MESLNNKSNHSINQSMLVLERESVSVVDDAGRQQSTAAWFNGERKVGERGCYVGAGQWKGNRYPFESPDGRGGHSRSVGDSGW